MPCQWRSDRVGHLFCAVSTDGQLAQMLRATREGKTRFFGQNTRPYGGGTPLVHAARGGGGGDVAHQEVELVVPGLENRLLRGGGDVASI